MIEIIDSLPLSLFDCKEAALKRRNCQLSLALKQAKQLKEMFIADGRRVIGELSKIVLKEEENFQQFENFEQCSEEILERPGINLGHVTYQTEDMLGYFYKLFLLE